MNAIEQAAKELVEYSYCNDEEWSEKTLEDIFVAGTKFALEKVRKDLCRELTNICEFDVYVEPSYYIDSINSIIENIDKLQE